ncbi:MAG: relaxase/mobilization nuclease domain-containing protein [Oscillospiraceae bacterium]|nr:relaxase/mobilization nuclease domain-containing protein [Oscillospiraceae bacterium]
MPYIKSISIHQTVNRSIAYILNPDKTGDLMYATSLNCLTNAADAYLAMRTVYEHFSGYKFNEPIPLKGKGRVKAIHYIQSFDPQDNVSPELAHRIAKAFARKTFGDDCQIVIATHCDKSHIHNHYIINTYSLTGEKFNANKKTLDRIKEYSDRVCLAFGVQPYDKSKGKGKTVMYNEWENKRRGTSWKEKIRNEIDNLIYSVNSFEDLLNALETKGYTVKRGKNISVKAPEQQRAVRLKTLGDDYSEENLSSRILWKDFGANTAKSELQSCFDSAIKNNLDVYKLSAQLAIINRDNIHSIGELDGKIQKLKIEYENARREFNKLSEKLSQFEAVEKQVGKYFDLLEKSELSETEKLQLKMYGSIAERCNIHSRDELQRVEKLRKDTFQKVERLSEQMKKCKQTYDAYADIADNYKKISEGDYISNLIKEKKQQDENKPMTAAKKRSR